MVMIGDLGTYRQITASVNINKQYACMHVNNPCTLCLYLYMMVADTCIDTWICINKSLNVSK